MCASLVLSLMTAAAPASAQAAYAASVDRPRLMAGGGFAAYNPDWGGKYSYGYSAVVDWHPPIMPGFLNDVNLEGEFRGLAFGLGNGRYTTIVGTQVIHSYLPTLYTVGGGLTYQPARLRFHRFSPYAKALGSWGSISWYAPGSTYSSDSRTVTSVGGGVDYRLTRRFTARVDYEYQWWPQLFGPECPYSAWIHDRRPL